MNQGMWEASRRWKRLGNSLSSTASRREQKGQTRAKTEAESDSEVVIIIHTKEDGF